MRRESVHKEFDMSPEKVFFIIQNSTVILRKILQCSNLTGAETSRINTAHFAFLKYLHCPCLNLKKNHKKKEKLALRPFFKYFIFFNHIRSLDPAESYVAVQLVLCYYQKNHTNNFIVFDKILLVAIVIKPVLNSNNDKHKYINKPLKLL